MAEIYKILNYAIKLMGIGLLKRAVIYFCFHFTKLKSKNFIFKIVIENGL